MTTTVVNIRKGSPDAGTIARAKAEGKFVRIDRRSRWGNPFVVGKDGTRDEVCAKHAAWILTQPRLMESIGELRGKVLGCWCAPERCHGDTLARLADGAE